MPVPKKKPKGSLYQKYHNTVSKLRRSDLWVDSKKTFTHIPKQSSEQEHLQPTYGKYLKFKINNY